MGDINNHDDGGVTVNPDKAGSSSEGKDVGGASTPLGADQGQSPLQPPGEHTPQNLDLEERPDPDYEVTLEMADRTVTLTLAEGEAMALQNQMGQPFAQLTITDLDE